MSEQKNQVEEYVEQILTQAAETITDNLKFMEVALKRLKMVLKRGVHSAYLEGDNFYYEPSYILEKSIEDSNYPIRLLLHSLCHAVFVHSFTTDRANVHYWDLACDIAVENLIIEMGIREFALAIDDDIRSSFREIKRYSTGMTAEKIYRYMLANPPSEEAMENFRKLFTRDIHNYHKSSGNLEDSETEWRKISDRIKIELKVFSKSSGRADSFIGNLDEATRLRYDYRKLLERFCQDSDSVKVSDDEFDYVYYSFGLMNYDGMPFVEPLEYSAERDVRDFIIVMDESSYCRPELVQGFLTRTYEIIKYINSYIKDVNLHIIRCTKEGYSMSLVQSRDDLVSYLVDKRAFYSGGKDFRPAFDHVDKLLRDRTFKDFRGLIYFTDGYGPFPGKNPGYECIFAFVTEESQLPKVPWWATPIIVDEDSLQI